MNPILDCFSKTVASCENDIAITDSKNSYSFLELRSFSARLGNTIAKTGTKNAAIGVFANRTAETAIMFLASLYSGNYYVPLDPDIPDAKLLSIIEDANITTILGDETNIKRLTDISYSDKFFTIRNMDSEECDIPEADDKTPLYMVYTSGSTGKPKGVLKSHGAMINYLNAYTNTFDFSADDVIGNQTPFFFDASAKDIYLMIKVGARIDIIPTELFSFPVRLIEFLNQQKVTFISWVPTALCIVTQLNTFIEILPTTLKRVFFVGEVMPRKHLEKWRKALPDIEYVNLYGSSEISGICCYYRVEDNLPEGLPLPLGKPLENCCVFLMNDNEFVTEPGVVGEIHIASDALALEYYNDPKKTADCFVEMMTPDGSMKRVFKTGDMAVYDENGNLSFSARKDFQIKHMGRRIELGEIESIADTIDEIRRCCCLYNSEKKQIVLFCELSADCHWTARDVRSSLKGILTDYMLPGKVIIKESLPINANGKIDRQKLKTEI